MPARRSTEADGGEAIPAPAFEALVTWYRSEARELPWRGTDDPYRILVSEVMLQQTRVETARQRYGAFLARFPDIEALADADEEDVLAEWSGLGYYRRARFLHRLAGRVVAEHGGRLPRDAGALRELPGVGDYTAAAVASIAWDLPHLAVDGNVARVMARLLALDIDPRSGAGREILEAAARPALERHAPGTFNQALMELGARICLPRGPRCDACPVAEYCAARAAGIQEDVPASRRSSTELVEEASAVLRRDDRYLLFRGQRPGVLRGMWEFPTLDSRLRDSARPGVDGHRAPRSVAEALHGGQEPPITASRDGELPFAADGLAAELAAHLRSLELPLLRLRHVGEIRHGITSRRIRCQVYRGELDEVAGDAREQEPAFTPRRRGWFDRDEIAELPLAASTRKTLELLD